MLIAKADCYGAGAECALILEPHVDYYGVAKAVEGARLRRMGVSKPILVLSHSSEQLGLEANYQLMPSISSLEQLIAARDMHITEAHIAVDSGMNRHGFNDVNKLIKALNMRKTLRISGVFSHISHNTVENIAAQASIFDSYIQLMDSMGISEVIRHLYSSYGLEIAVNSNMEPYEMARLGLGAYNAANYIVSNILLVKAVAQGECIGYEKSYRADRNMRIAIIEGGYADGIPRRYKGSIIINGAAACVVGYVCMDTLMVDVSNIDCNEGDKVVLLDNSNISLGNMAAWAKLSEYEMLTVPTNRSNSIILL